MFGIVIVMFNYSCRLLCSTFLHPILGTFARYKGLKWITCYLENLRIWLFWANFGSNRKNEIMNKKILTRQWKIDTRFVISTLKISLVGQFLDNPQKSCWPVFLFSQLIILKFWYFKQKCLSEIFIHFDEF